MFRLVGSESFRIGRFECKLDVEPDGTFGLLYSLFINGQDIREFQEANKKRWITWNVDFGRGNRDAVLFGNPGISKALTTQPYPILLISHNQKRILWISGLMEKKLSVRCKTI